MARSPAPPPGPPRGLDGGLDVFCLLLLTSPNGPRPPNLMFEPERVEALLVLDGWDPPDRIAEPDRIFEFERKLDADLGLAPAPLAFVEGFHFFPGSFLYVEYPKAAVADDAAARSSSRLR